MDENAKGALMEPIVCRVRPLIENRAGLQLFHDHTLEGAQHVRCFFGCEPHGWNTLSLVDLLIADRESGKALLIIEVEETGADPKRMLGDVFAVALSEHISVWESGDKQKPVTYEITPETEVWVCFPATKAGGQRKRAEKLKQRIPQKLRIPVHVDFVIVETWDDLVPKVAARVKAWLECRP